MQYATILLGFLATMAAAAPTKEQSKGKRIIEQRDDGPLRVILETDFFDSAAADFFSGLAADFLATSLGELDAKAPAFQGPYGSVTLDVGSGSAAARCQVIDTNGEAVTLVRGANVDVSFGDGGNGPWRAQNGQPFRVQQIKCDPEFKSAN
ncbi:hypothetical protein PG990_006240 [Apiospora arundinis]